MGEVTSSGKIGKVRRPLGSGPFRNLETNSFQIREKKGGLEGWRNSNLGPLGGVWTTGEGTRGAGSVGRLRKIRSKAGRIEERGGAYTSGKGWGRPRQMVRHGLIFWELYGTKGGPLMQKQCSRGRNEWRGVLRSERIKEHIKGVEGGGMGARDNKRVA